VHLQYRGQIGCYLDLSLPSLCGYSGTFSSNRTYLMLEFLHILLLSFFILYYIFPNYRVKHSTKTMWMDLRQNNYTISVRINTVRNQKFLSPCWDSINITLIVVPCYTNNGSH